jgi:hypothetical protein
MTSTTKQEGIGAAHLRCRSLEMTNKTERKREEEDVIPE